MSMRDLEKEEDDEYIAVPGVDGDVMYLKRNPDLEIRVVFGPKIVEWLRSNQDWEKIQDMSTLQFVNNVVRPLISEKMPRMWEHLKEPVAVSTKRKSEDVNKSTSKLTKEGSATYSKPVGKFKPGFFSPKDNTYGRYTLDYNFISHVWAQPVKHLLGYLGSTVLHSWCDIFAVSQIGGAAQDEDLKNITESVFGASEMKVMVDREGIVFNRIWCLFEMITRVRSGKGTVKFVVPEMYFQLGVFQFDDFTIEERKIYWRESARILSEVLKKGIDCRKAHASVEKDRVRILNWIEKDYGAEKFNQDISELIQNEIMKLRMIAGPVNRVDGEAVSFAEAVKAAREARKKLNEQAQLAAEAGKQRTATQAKKMV